MNSLLISIMLLLAVTLSQASQARIKVIDENDDLLSIELTSKFIMGDADSILDARRISMIEAKRMASEYAGTIVESETIVENYEVTSDEVKTYAASSIKIEKLSEKREQTPSGSIKFILKIRADIDKKSIVSRIENMISDPEEREKVDRISENKHKLFKQMGKLSHQIKGASQAGNYDKAQQLSQQRSAILKVLPDYFELVNKNILTLNSKLEENHQALLNINSSIKDLKKETSSDPKKELANLGYDWSTESFLSALLSSDVKSIKLFYAGGMNLQRSLNLSESPLLYEIFKNKINDYYRTFKVINANESLDLEKNFRVNTIIDLIMTKPSENLYHELQNKIKSQRETLEKKFNTGVIVEDEYLFESEKLSKNEFLYPSILYYEFSPLLVAIWFHNEPAIDYLLGLGIKPINGSLRVQRGNGYIPYSINISNEIEKFLGDSPYAYRLLNSSGSEYLNDSSL